VMRHFLAAQTATAVAPLAGGMPALTFPGRLIPRGGRPLTRAASRLRARPGAVAMTSVTESAEDEKRTARRASTMGKSMRFHASPDRDTGSWTRSGNSGKTVSAESRPWGSVRGLGVITSGLSLFCPWLRAF
jgi:hypothetical protein